jgi:hypothetical protein
MTKARLPMKKKNNDEERDSHGRTIQGKKFLSMKNKRPSGQVDILSSTDKTRAAREIETKQHLIGIDSAQFKFQQVHLTSGAKILTSAHAGNHFSNNAPSYMENL